VCVCVCVLYVVCVCMLEQRKSAANKKKPDVSYDSEDAADIDTARSAPSACP
jgi:hypothetical protein